MISRFIAGKYRNPTGIFGKLVGNSMAQGNEPAARWTVSLLNIQPQSHVLEIGFGPGIGIQYTSQQAQQGLVAGIDSSKTMLDVARKRNAAAIASGHVDLQYGGVSHLPYPNASFDIVFTIHCIYFWANPIDDLKEVRRVLKTDGLLAVTIMPKANWSKQRTPPTDLSNLYSGDEVVSLLSEAGFHNVRVEANPQADIFPGVCILGMNVA